MILPLLLSCSWELSSSPLNTSINDQSFNIISNSLLELATIEPLEIRLKGMEDLISPNTHSASKSLWDLAFVLAILFVNKDSTHAPLFGNI